MKEAPRPLPPWLKWTCLIFGMLIILGSAYGVYLVVMPLQTALHIFFGPKGHSISDQQWMSVFAKYAGKLAGLVVAVWFGVWLLLRAGDKRKTDAATSGAEPPLMPAEAPAVVSPTPVYSAPVKNRRWSYCNVLYLAPDAKRLWQFDAKGKGFVLGREQRVPHAETLPASWVAKSWSSLWQPKLNIAWLPSDSVFLRVVELPAANAEETFSMVELQLEKLSPIPLGQIVWTMHVLGTHQSAAKADGTVESLQMIIVVIASRAIVEDFLGRLERDGFLADRLEVPMLDQLEAVAPKEDGIWFFPLTIGGQNAALVAWWFGGAWRNLSIVTLPPAGDRAGELKNQIGLLAMAGEVEGWLTGQPLWHLVADPVNATEWEQLLRAALNEPVRVVPPPSPAELAGRSAVRAAASTAPVQLQPAEFATRYREQLFDRLWLHALGYLGAAYAAGLVIYFCLVAWEGYQMHGMESQVAAMGGSYTNAIQLKARLAVLQERSQLKYAALDCWQLVAENLPASVTLQRSSFVDGSKLTLSGQVDESDTQKLIDFYDALRKAKNPKQPDQPFFTEGEPLAYRGQKVVAWNFSLQLTHVEEEPN